MEGHEGKMKLRFGRSHPVSPASMRALSKQVALPLSSLSLPKSQLRPGKGLHNLGELWPCPGFLQSLLLALQQKNTTIPGAPPGPTLPVGGLELSSFLFYHHSHQQH